MPVLLISGGADPVTPPAYGEKVAASLPNSVHLVLEGAAHVGQFALVECAQPVMRRLYDGADLDDVDLTCGGHTFERAPFFLGE